MNIITNRKGRKTLSIGGHGCFSYIRLHKISNVEHTRRNMMCMFPLFSLFSLFLKTYISACVIGITYIQNKNVHDH